MVSLVKTVQDATAQLKDRCSENNAYPMWTVVNTIAKNEPCPKAVPLVWRHDEMRKILMDSASLVPEELAERRSLMLINPSFRGSVSQFPSPNTTDTLFGGYQMVLPGETAPAHRHMAFAVRAILESDRGFTSVGGQKIYLEEGDLVLTPSWQWHYHGNEGDTPTLWIDSLDLPLHTFIKSNFLELHPTPKVPDLVTTGSPFHFPWKQVKAILDSQKGPHALHHYRNNGSHFSRSIAAQAERIEAGSTTQRLRETVSFIYIVQSGHGSSTVNGPTGNLTITWKAKDVIAIPSWSWLEHTVDAGEDAYLFAISDRALVDSLGLYRVEYSK